MLKACVTSLCQNQESSSRRKQESGARTFGSQSRDFSVRIVHAGGREEFYPYAIPASYLMEKYPGMCVARPEVFKNPPKALLKPEEELLPGHKYLMMPLTTARKLKRTHSERLKALADENVNITWEASLDVSDESVSSAKEFYATRGKFSREPKRSGRKSMKGKKAFVPPQPKTRIVRGIGWEPSLTSVQELSP